MDELGYVVCGSVDSGKSTLIGTIISNKLDDGNGSNRALVSAHKHEINTGKTSSIAVHSIKKYQNNKSIIMIDLCGHEKYLKTTLYGIMGYYPDYAIVIIGANRGILKMTREHIKILHHLKIPIILALTKIDLVDKLYEGAEQEKYATVLDKMTDDITKVFAKGNYNVVDMNKIKEKDLLETIPTIDSIPLFKLSCKTGFGLDIFKNYISVLPKKQDYKLDLGIFIPIVIQNKKKLDDFIFYVEKVYCPPGIGWVITGILKCVNPDGFIQPGTQIYVGPNTEVIQTKVWSIHNYYQEKIDRLYNGQRGCLAIRSDKKLSYEFFRKGTVLTNNLEILKKATYKYKAQIKLLSHPSNVRDNFSPVIHCATIRQTASIKIIEIKTKSKKDEETRCMYPGDTAIIQLEFKFKPELIEPKQSFFLREGLTLGVGTILEPVY